MRLSSRELGDTAYVFLRAQYIAHKEIEVRDPEIAAAIGTLKGDSRYNPAIVHARDRLLREDKIILKTIIAHDESPGGRAFLALPDQVKYTFAGVLNTLSKMEIDAAKGMAFLYQLEEARVRLNVAREALNGAVEGDAVWPALKAELDVALTLANTGLSRSQEGAVEQFYKRYAALSENTLQDMRRIKDVEEAALADAEAKHRLYLLEADKTADLKKKLAVSRLVSQSTNAKWERAKNRVAIEKQKRQEAELAVVALRKQLGLDQAQL